MANKLSSLLQPCSLPHISLVTGRVSWLIRKKNKSWMLPRSPLQRTSWSSDMKGGAPRPSEGFYHLKPTEKKWLIFGENWLIPRPESHKNHLKKGWVTCSRCSDKERHIQKCQWLISWKTAWWKTTNKQAPGQNRFAKKSLACPKNW